MSRLLLLLAATGACNSSPAPAAEPPAPIGATSKLNKPRLALDHVTLLEPEAVIGARLADQAAFTARLKSASAVVSDWDAAHANALPAELDLILTVRPTGLRVWLVGADGDLTAAPDLAAKLTSLPAVPVKDGYVAAVATLVRGKASRATGTRRPYLPAAWLTAAGSAGKGVDDIIDAAWPR